MLAMIADAYTPLLALGSIVCLKNTLNRTWVIAFIAAYAYVYAFAFIEFYFGWWAAMGGDFSSHTAAVVILTIALLRVDLRIGIAATISVFAYAYIMTLLNYHSWFDVFTTIVICLPCWWMFPSLKRLEI